MFTGQPVLETWLVKTILKQYCKSGNKHKLSNLLVLRSNGIIIKFVKYLVCTASSLTSRFGHFKKCKFYFTTIRISLYPLKPHLIPIMSKHQTSHKH